MAEFNADIKLRLITEGIERKLKNVERKIGDALEGGKQGRANKLLEKRNTILSRTEKINQKIRNNNLNQLNDYSKISRFMRQMEDNQQRINAAKEKELQLNKKNAAAASKAAKRDRANRIQGLQLGVGFPLLFGGGVGSVAGGALGALTDTSGGFGGQILFSAIGQQIDQFVVKTGELGQALNPVTADVGKIVDAAGLANTELGKTITELENTAGSAVALKEATKELERVVGEDGVAALREFGDRFTILGNQLAEFFTQVQVAVAKLLQETPTEKNLRTTGETIFQARRSDNTEIQDAVSRLDNSSIPSERLAIQKEIVALVNEEADARQRELELMAASTGEAAEKLANNEMELRILNAKYALEQAGSDLTSDTVYELSKKLIQQEYFKELQDAINKGLVAEGLLQAGNIAELKMKIKLAALANKRTAAFDKANKTPSGGSAPQSKALQLQQQLIKEDLKRTEIGIKYLQIIQGEEAALKAKQSLLVERLAQETEVLELQRQQALENNKVAGDAALINQVFDSRIETLTQQLQLQQQQNAERLRAIALERELQQLKADQAFATESIGFSRELEDIQARTANPFGGFQAEQLELATAQARRYEDAMRDIANQEELLRAQRTDANASTIDPQLAQLKRKKQLYEEMLPAIAAAEQAELKMAQTLQALQPITDGLAAGITDFFTSVIDGSKSAEEAFADMLKGMAAALIQQGAQMIAQYMAIALARALAGMGGSGGGGFSGAPQLSGIPFSAGGIGYRANGGPVNENAPYIVGENGPELFVPGKSGTVVNNSDFADAAAAMTGASQAFTDSGEAMAMATATRSANTAAAAEASAMQTAETYFANGKSTISFDTYRVGEMDVVTREDAIKIGMQSAKKAEANVYKGLRNMPAVRGRTGVK